MKVTYVITECRDKLSPKCAKTFNREVKRGRPQVNCDACKAVKVTPAKSATIATDQVRKGECPCGNEFTINPGRGRKPTKCDACRANGTVYRTDEDGEIQTIRAEALAEEQREIREQNGRDRAAALVDLMAPLIKKDEQRRMALAGK